MSHLRASIAACVVTLICAAPVHATIIDLSTHSSNETPAEVLLASFDFEIIGGTQLSVTVTNNTAGIDSYNISEIYFNFDEFSGVTGLSYANGPPAWSDSIDQMVNGFGVFDIGVTANNVNQSFGPGESNKFLFDILGVGFKEDFISGSSDGFLIAAKFIMGPGDDSAFGATLPGPGVLAAFGAFGLLTRGRRRRS